MRTAVFDTISSLRPYFFSLRELGQNVSLDIKLPASWKYEELVKSDIAIKIQDENEKNRLISIIAPVTKEGYDLVFTTAKKIIKMNQEEEEKIKLFNATVDGLKNLFLNSSLDKLREISFIKDGISNKESARETGSGNKERPGTDGEA